MSEFYALEPGGAAMLRLLQHDHFMKCKQCGPGGCQAHAAQCKCETTAQSHHRVTGLLPWPGGKSWLVPRLLRLIPPHRCYCEVFGGAGAFLLSKPRSEVEVYNDASNRLVELFRCVRFHRDALLEEMELVLNSRDEFKAFIAQPGLTEIQRAARWFFRVSTCFGGSSIDSFGVAKKNGGAAMGSRIGRLNKLAALSQRLDRVCIERLDWRDCLCRYDGLETFFFLDPPYTNCDPKMYAGWSAEEMAGFAAALPGLKARWMVTVNDTEANRDLFRRFHIHPLARTNMIENRPGKKLKPIYRELLISRDRLVKVPA